MNGINEMVAKINQMEAPEPNTIMELLSKFHETNPSYNADLVASAKNKLAEVFTTEELSHLDGCFVSTEMLNLLLFSATVSKFENMAAYHLMGEENTGVSLQILCITLISDEQIHVLNAQERVLREESYHEE